MRVTIGKEMCRKDIEEIPNVDKKVIKYLREKGHNTIGEVLRNQEKLNKKYYEHYKSKLLDVIWKIRKVDEK